MSNIAFPIPVDRNGRKYFVRHQIEAYKRALAGLPISDSEIGVIEFVPAPQVASELGYCRRTLGRRMRDDKGVAGDDGKAA